MTYLISGDQHLRTDPPKCTTLIPCDTAKSDFQQ